MEHSLWGYLSATLQALNLLTRGNRMSSQAHFKTLLRSADVFVTNIRIPALKKLRLDYKSVRA